MNRQRLFVAIALAASALGCKSNPRQDAASPAFCSHIALIAPNSPWTQDWEGCVEGWRTLAGVPVSSMLATDATSPAKPHVQALTKVVSDSSLYADARG